MWSIAANYGLRLPRVRAKREAMHRLIAFLFITTSLLAEHPFGGPLSSAQRAPVLAQFAQVDTARRAAAVVRLRADGAAAAGADVKSALSKLDEPAVTRLRNLLRTTKPADPTVENVRRDFREWKAASDAARAIVQIDHHKDKKKFDEMDRAFQRAEKALMKIVHGLKLGSNSAAADLIESATLVAQVRRDLAWADGKESDIAVLAIGELAKAEKPSIGLEQFVVELDAFIALRESNRLVTAAHAQMKSAKPEAVQYAELLNARRFVIGMRPLLLGEKLSAACAQHSEEMVKLKYFAHDSPVPANKSPWDRVKNAGFEGSGGGECIFAGGSAARDAHTGWWYSDGHRLILYSEAKAQGIAKFGNTWTFMTGSFTTFPF